MYVQFTSCVYRDSIIPFSIYPFACHSLFTGLCFIFSLSFKNAFGSITAWKVAQSIYLVPISQFIAMLSNIAKNIGTKRVFQKYKHSVYPQQISQWTHSRKYRPFRNFLVSKTKTFSGPSPTSKMELFAKTVNGSF